MSKTALVTGGSQGIGRGISLELAAQGINVAVNYFGEANAAAGEEVAQACAELGVESLAVNGDVSNYGACEAMLKTAADKFGSVDILINNAGITRDNLILRMTEQDFLDVINTNLNGAFFCAKAAIRPMLKKRWGRIVNISSVVGIMGNTGQVNYSAAKAGIIGLTKSLAKECAGRNITVNAVAPGFITTAMTEVLSPEAKAKMKAAIPMARFGSTEDVAKAVAFLVSDDAAYITGQVIAVDGGMAM
ncbi:MAG: 3-oxoacyl-[acyl-carrier-protein] reductase [Bacillota bacterium]|nr:3-oxoacyl-[acyl-carrier-protein] reductase [Bacillota bacterium]